MAQNTSNPFNHPIAGTAKQITWATKILTTYRRNALEGLALLSKNPEDFGLREGTGATAAELAEPLVIRWLHNWDAGQIIDNRDRLEMDPRRLAELLATSVAERHSAALKAAAKAFRAARRARAML